jgi:5-hydroxyisourate hydrolase-like protein (transthyretin family)
VAIVKIRVHVADVLLGVPAADLDVVLRHRSGPRWQAVVQGRTDTGGDLDLWAGDALRPGVYSVVLDFEGYYAMLGISALLVRGLTEFRIGHESGDLALWIQVAPDSCDVTATTA